MENINIAAILRDKPKGTKLYDALRGVDVCLDSVTWYIYCTEEGFSYYYTSNGGVSSDYPNGLQILKPSKEMQDWSKFAWKKGDVLLSGVDNFCIFGGWANDDYTEFHAKFVSGRYSDDTCKTLDWTKEYNEKVIKQYISNIEEIKGGKLNLETLEIDTQTQFKDGDIVVYGDIVFYEDSEHEEVCSSIFIFRGKQNHTPRFLYHAVLDSNGFFSAKDGGFGIYEGTLRLATDSEKELLFSKLAKIGKKWNPDTKQVEDLPKKYKFKPFQKVLVRDDLDNHWRPAFFYKGNSDKDYPYTMIGGEVYSECIPYNVKTVHLLGTTDDWKGGEG